MGLNSSLREVGRKCRRLRTDGFHAAVALGIINPIPLFQKSSVHAQSFTDAHKPGRAEGL